MIDKPFTKTIKYSFNFTSSAITGRLETIILYSIYLVILTTRRNQQIFTYNHLVSQCSVPLTSMIHVSLRMIGFSKGPIMAGGGGGGGNGTAEKGIALSSCCIILLVPVPIVVVAVLLRSLLDPSFLGGLTNMKLYNIITLLKTFSILQLRKNDFSPAR